MLRRARNIPLPEPHLVALGLGVVVGLFAPWTWSASPRLLGVALIVAGFGWAGWAAWVSGDTHLARPDRLVVRGPYAQGRNPMYVGWTVAYLGIALALGNVWLLVLLPFVAGLTHLAVLREEQRLRVRFGVEYERYAATVRRYL